MLSECAAATRGQRPGFLPFHALCVSRRLAAHWQIGADEAMRELEQLARALGGELVEEEVLWLPEARFEEVWSAR